MPRVRPSERKRAWKPKTKTGCRTCRIRRVKCDEAKPDCLKCISTGRTCDGYDVQTPPRQEITGIDTVTCVLKTAKERRAFRFFQERSTHQLSGLYNCEFWSRTILQAIFVDPGLRCAVVAFGSLHEGYEQTGNSKSSDNNFALMQYDASIRSHIENLSGLQVDRDKIDNYVASSMIFVCIEILQGHYQSALCLIKGAVKLFYQSQGFYTKHSSWPLEILETLLSRLQSQAIAMFGFASVGATVPPTLKDDAFPYVSQSFSDPEKAKESLEFYSHVHALTQLTLGTSDAMRPQSSRFHAHLRMLRQWGSAFESMITTSGDGFSETEKRAVNILRLWQIMAFAGISMHLDFKATIDDQIYWDNFIDGHTHIVELAEEILQGRNGGESTHKVEHVFTMDVGIVGPLFDTARTCRDPLIRRKAISLLRRYPSREGLWDSLLAARATERQMEIEESAVLEVKNAADIPGWARVTSIVPTFHVGERWAEVMYTKQRPAVGEPERIREFFEW